MTGCGESEICVFSTSKNTLIRTVEQNAAVGACVQPLNQRHTHQPVALTFDHQHRRHPVEGVVRHVGRVVDTRWRYERLGEEHVAVNRFAVQICRGLHRNVVHHSPLGDASVA